MKIVETYIPRAVKSMDSLIRHFQGKIKAETPEIAQRKINQLSEDLDMAIEALERLNPMELTDSKCPGCGRVFSEEELTDGEFFYCPFCGQALIDWLDEDITTDV